MKIKTKFFDLKKETSIFNKLSFRDKYLVTHVFDIINEEKLKSDLDIDYPWCFVLSPEKEQGRNCFVGSFIVRKQGDNKYLTLSYTNVIDDWLLENLASDTTLPFWLSRILNIEQSDDSFNIKNEQKKWLTALHFYYRPFLERIVLTSRYRFSQRLPCLLEINSQADLWVAEQDGIVSMPWNNWPICTKAHSTFWLWRQSRFKKILESRLLICHGISGTFV